jgi:hypothetical protein
VRLFYLLYTMRKTFSCILFLSLLCSCRKDETKRAGYIEKYVVVDISVYNRNYSFEFIPYQIFIDKNIIIREKTNDHFFKSVHLQSGHHTISIKDQRFDIKTESEFYISDSAHAAGLKIFNEYVPPYKEHLEFLADEKIRRKQLDTTLRKNVRNEYISKLWTREGKKSHVQKSRRLRLEYYEDTHLHKTKF